MIVVQIARLPRQPQAHQESHDHHRRHVPEERRLVPQRLQSQRHVLRRAAEDRVGHRVGQAHAQGAYFGREHLRLHDAADRGVEAHDGQRHHDQREGGHRARHVLQRREDRHRADGAQRAEQQHVVAAADAVRQRPENGLHAHVEEQRAGHHVAGRLDRQAHRVHEVLLHVGREGIEDQRAAGRVAQHREEGRLVVAEEAADGAGIVLLPVLVALRLVQRAAQHQRDHRRDGADHERDAPAPGLELGIGQQRLQDHDHQHRQQLPADQRHVLERREEAALPAQRHLAHVGGRGAVLAAHRQALEQPAHQQQEGRPGTDGRIGGQAGDHQRARAHHGDRDQHRGLAAVAVRDAAEQPAADGPHEEARGEHARRVQQLGSRVRLREERRREIQRRERIHVEIEPFHEVARRGRHDREDPVALLFGGVGAGFGVRRTSRGRGVRAHGEDAFLAARAAGPARRVCDVVSGRQVLCERCGGLDVSQSPKRSGPAAAHCGAIVRGA